MLISHDYTMAKRQHLAIPRGQKRPRIHWDPGPGDSSSSTSDFVNIKNGSVSVSQSGRVSSRTSYISVNASPKKAPASQPPEPTVEPIEWRNVLLSEDDGWVDEVEKRYEDHVHEVNVFPKKSKRAGKVRSMTGFLFMLNSFPEGSAL